MPGPGKVLSKAAAWLSAVSAAGMAAVGYSDFFYPPDFPLAAVAGLAMPAFILLNALLLAVWLLVRPKGALIPLAGFVLCYPSIRAYCPLNMVEEPPRGAFKVVSCNVWQYCHWERETGAKEIFRYLRDQDADIVCLQESFVNANIATLPDSFLAGRYPYFETIFSKEDADVLSLYSKHPIIAKRRIEYDSRANVSAVFQVLVGGDTLWVVNNHFETTGLGLEQSEMVEDIVEGDYGTSGAFGKARLMAGKLAAGSAKRAGQVDAVAALVDSLQGRSVVLCGDFNDGPVSYARRELAARLTDCYVAAGLGPGFSYDRNKMKVRIDHIMCSEDWEPKACKVDRSMSKSDHYPIVCWLEKKPGGKQ